MKLKRGDYILTKRVVKILISFWSIVLISCGDHKGLSSAHIVAVSRTTDAFHSKFTRDSYIVTIPENSIGKTYALPKLYDEKMGLEIHSACSASFKIVSGDRDKLFKADERIIGNFVFLAIRTRTSNVVLNREKNEEYNLQVKAFITCPRNNRNFTYETDCLVNLHVLDRNDLSPLFYPTEYTAAIFEDLPVHSSVLQVMAEDADLGLNGEIYYSFLDDTPYFSIHPTSGVITNVRSLINLGTKQIRIVVLAVDRGSYNNRQNQHSSKATVTINIEKSNLHAPELQVTTIPNIELREGVNASNNIFGVVRFSDKDSGKNGQAGDVRIISGDEDGIFYITPSKTKWEYYIKLKELFLLSNISNIFNVTIQAEDKGIPPKKCLKVIPIEINIDDNDGLVFTKELYEVSIPESSPSNMPVIRLKVADPNMGKNALVFLEIVGGNEGGEFKINPETGMLYTQKPLDAEKTSLYTLTVSAIDQAVLGTRQQSSAKVKINVIDINDNDPVFVIQTATVFLKENELPGSYVTKVSAKDKDSGENAFITYSIANLKEVPFEIDHFSGVIRTTSLIDYEVMRRFYKLKVRASDWGLPYRRQAEMEVLINIGDVNDNRPQFERVNCVGKIFRRTPVGTDVFTLSAIDLDGGDFITYRLISGNDDGCFNLDPTTGVITIGCDLSDVDAEKRSINVSATDGTHFSDEMTILIHLLKDDRYSLNSFSSFECHETGIAKKLADIFATSEKNNVRNEKEFESDNYFPIPSIYGQNVHKPEFISFPQELDVNESLPLGDTITWFKAKDRDLGYNGKLVYGISDGDFDSVFRVDPESGELQLIGYLDRERQEEYILNISVCDLGQPAKCDSKILKVNILDVNDNPPLFQKTIARFHLGEDSPKNTLVFCLNATDADNGKNSEIVYEIKSDTNNFEINSTTGCVFLKRKLDREEQDRHLLQIYAKDGGIPSLTGEAMVTIVVGDVNDNAPIFGMQEMIFKIREDLPKGTIVAKIEAIDLDEGVNGEILFFLKEDSTNANLFQIDKNTGIIRTKGYLDYETKQIYNLIISAKDCGNPPLISNMPVVIEVIDVNENRFAPEFDDFVYVRKIKENVKISTVVGNITAKDMDTNGPDSEISYSIRGGDGMGLFAVNQRGSIRTLSHLDAETKNFYWLTLCAQDHAIVPLTTCTQVYIEVENINDNVPMTDQPVYYSMVIEGSRSMVQILRLNASDNDLDPTTSITYRIISGNPEGFFEINKTTGELMTTERKLDRENQEEHILEILISDNGSPPLYSTTRVVLSVEDVNDNSPQFDQRFYKAHVPSNISDNTSIFQIMATDNDVGENGRVSYFIKSGKGKNKFRIDAATGLLFATKPLEIETEYELIIKAEDNGNPKKSQATRLNIVVIPILNSSKTSPTIKTLNNLVEVTESDKPGFLVTLIQAFDNDSDHLWYNITRGNEDNEFFIGHDNGNVLLSKSLDFESKNFYNLTIGVSDGSNLEETQLFIKVVDINDNRPQFSKDIYVVNISENIKEETVILQLHATDKDEDKKIFYTLHGSEDPLSLEFFRIDSVSGNVIVTQRLDYERKKRHELIVTAKDQGTPAKRNYAKVIVIVHDHNDHYPVFSNKILQSKIPESSAIGSKIVQLSAIDRDSGKNGEIKYSLVSGNVGNIFQIDEYSGTVFLSQALDLQHMQEYMLQVKATDGGNPPLSSQIPLHVIVVMAENDPPRFNDLLTSIEIYENLQTGTFITRLEALSSSSVFYSMVDGNDEGFFYINPSTGVMLVNSKIDFETHKLFNLTVKGTNMASVSSYQNVIIHILDVNDNPPYFVQMNYHGQISEASSPGSYVYTNNSEKNLLLLKVIDEDSGQNSVLEFTIMADADSHYFQIDSLTGSVQLVQNLDYELKTSYKFNVKVNDKGTPKLSSASFATVLVDVLDVNDCPPVFENKEVNVTLYLPTYEGVIVAQVAAVDMDKDINEGIRYDIVDGNGNDNFDIDNLTGIITIRNIYELGHKHSLHVRASDGLFSSIALVNIYPETIGNKGFQFQKEKYKFSLVENSTKVSIVGIVNVIGNLLVENVEYRILNPTKEFEIGPTSGAIKTTGLVFDRELIDNYNLVIEAKSIIFENGKRTTRRSVVHVEVNILDINDNCPIFVNLPYYGTVSLEDTSGFVVLTIKAIDLDSEENGEVRYEMKKGNGDVFKVDRNTGDIILRQQIKTIDNKYDLLFAAYDNAITPCYTEVPVSIKVVDRSMPIFNKQFYYDTIREDIELFSALSVNILAESPLQRSLIYTTSSENEEFFEIDYRTGILRVVNSLDYEKQQSHELVVRATDLVSGAYAEVTVSIGVEDANDCYPIIENDNYNVTISENTYIGALILKINATDHDSNANSVLSYAIESTNGNTDLDIFYVNPADGSLQLKRQLDYEECKTYLVIVKVSDHGTPFLSSRTNVWITVKDENDNTPKFIEPSFSCKLFSDAPRGQFVLRANAYDADDCDNNKLKYKIVDGNEHQFFSIEQYTGIIVVQNNQRLQSHKLVILNISATDGLHTSYARVKITLLPENSHYPVFEKPVYEASVMENGLPDIDIITVKAEDKDFGIYGLLSYEIISDEMSSFFTINKMTGTLSTKITLDREERNLYDVVVKATDSGGKFGFTLVKVTVNDSNDNAPKFPIKGYNWMVHDNTAIGTILGKVSAADLDDGPNGLVNYALENIDDGVNKWISLSSNGELVLTESLRNRSKNLIQFFVRALDNGYPENLSSFVPVSLQIVNSNVTVPSFGRNILNLTVTESCSPGSVLAKLKVTGNFSVKFSLASESSKFSITENGEITLIENLDRETNAIEYLSVMSETTTKPILFSYLDVYIYVQDENDNYPKFSNPVYNVNVPENTDKGISILKISAVDADEGLNGDVRYFIEDENYINLFEIDVHSGWITLLSNLDRETQSEYYFDVLAIDNGKSKLVSKAPVSITVMDYNDNPPVFKQAHHIVNVDENALPGTVLAALLVTDLDSETSNMDFFIVSGDNYSQFQVANSGEFYVSKPLDREFISFYNISICVTDGKFISYTTISIFVTDINDNFPICMTPRYILTISESVAVGTSIIKINSVDFDDDGLNKIRFYMTGNYSEDFYVDKDDGVLKVAKDIDREKLSKYVLLVHVQDGIDLHQECVCEVIITVSDVNDNYPTFTMEQFFASIPEDAQVETIVTKVHAIDKDFGLNRKITYSIVDKNEFFEIHNTSGIVKLNKPLDREKISMFNITIKAVDFGSPRLFSTAFLVIQVLDVNDNPPEFHLKHYNVVLSENASINTEVLRVHASSKDIGINAEISYYIVGGNEQMKFKIDSKIGAIQLNSDIDYEKTKAFLITVQAIDSGSPPLSSQAFVNISVLDVNDNLPQFSQNPYRVKVKENSKIGEQIVQIFAVDDDSGNNGIVVYNIERGDRLNKFIIDELFGYIYVKELLDREENSAYVLEVKACDKGIIQLCSFVQVFIDIVDINDNPPIFTNANYSILLQENKPLDFAVLTFNVTDADEYPNASPYTYDFKQGNEGGVFRLDQDGCLRTAFRFNHRIRDSYVLQIRVFDNGTPPLFSDAWVTVKIIEESQYPPMITPLDITVNSYEDDFVGGFLGRIFVSDQDQYDTFTYKLAQTRGQLFTAQNLFNITVDSGEIYAMNNLDVGAYLVNVTVSDGKFMSHAVLRVNVELVTEEMAKNAVLIKFDKISPKDFILSYKKSFQRTIREILRCRQKDIIIIGLNENEAIESNEISHNSSEYSLTRNERAAPDVLRKRRHRSILEVAFVVQKQQINPTSDSYYSPEEIINTLLKNIDEIEDSFNLSIEEIVSTECDINICTSGLCRNKLKINKNRFHTFYTDVISFVTPEFKFSSYCECKQGFAGKKCDKPINACSSNPCPPQRQCWPADTARGYQCICTAGFSGQYCEIQSSKCQNEKCLRMQTAVSFGGKSYAHYVLNKSAARSLLENQFSLSLKVRTVQQTGTLIYASGKIDYNIIEIINGAVQYRFELGSGEGLVMVSSIMLSDGEWHSIKLERILNAAKLIVDNKHTSQGSAPGSNVVLNQSNDIFIGAKVRPHHTIIGYEDIQRGFIGCMSDIKVGQETLPLYISSGNSVVSLKRFTNIEFLCDASKVLIKLGICGGQPCLNSGMCQDLGEEFACVCPERFVGKMCEIDMDPCASMPCLYGGVCQHNGPSNFSCFCPPHLSGKRCEYGRFCFPNPCKNGGICEEGDGTPHCMCRGFTGPTCEIDVDECENQPCGSGATCINEAGSFRCICPSYLTGASCGDPLYSNSISTKLKNFSIENITGIICGVSFVFIFCAITLCCIVCKRNGSKRKKRTKVVKNSYKESTLNSLLDKGKNNIHNTKISNLEVSRRPISFTSSSTDNMVPTNAHFVNNLDILRSYGSAGDELENIPFEYQKISLNKQNVNINNENISEAVGSSYKADWTDQSQLKTFCENKLNNGKCKDYNLPVNRLSSVKPSCGKLIQVTMPNVCQSSFGPETSCLGQYHWDCSDWARSSQNPLPDITEVPGAEIADSSSFHSNESNETTNIIHPSLFKLDLGRDIETLDEDMISDFVDAEVNGGIHQLELPLSSNSLLRLSPVYHSENEDYTSNSGKLYLRHPDSYLPPLNNLSETDGESKIQNVLMKRKAHAETDNYRKQSEFPCHSQNTERFVRVVSESADKVTYEKRMGYIFAKLKSREHYSKLESRQNFI